jgi:uncharacterized protein with PIN domain
MTDELDKCPHCQGTITQVLRQEGPAALGYGDKLDVETKEQTTICSHCGTALTRPSSAEPWRVRED